MKKIKKFQTCIIILIIIILIFLIYKLFNKTPQDTNYLAELYEQLNNSQIYLFEMEQDEDTKTIMAKKNEKTIIDQYSKDGHTTTIVKDDNTYLVLHNREEYYIYEHNNIEQTILTDGIKEIISGDFTIGKEKIKGKKYSYEEFDGSTIFMTASALDIDEKDIKTRFYFDDNKNLVYIRTIKGAKQELLKIKIEQDVDDKMFEIPSNYAEN